MGIEAISTGTKATIVATIATGLRVYASNELPDTPGELPCIMILPGPSVYATAFDKSFDLTLRLLLLMSKQDSPAAFNRLLDYIDTSGARSIWLALDADRTLNATAHSSKLISNSGAGSTIWGGIGYLSTEFELGIWSK